MKIVVTGAAGFLGGRTAKHFAKHFKEDTIIATSRRSDRQNELYTEGAHFVGGDLTNPDFCDALTKNVEIVVHCAAFSSPFGDYETFYQSNFVATDCLLKASTKNGVKKFIFISTPSIYFNFEDRFNVKEADPLPSRMVNNYAKTKLMAEELVLNFNNKGIETIALRPRAIIGAEDTVLFPRVLEAYNQGKLKIVGDGKNICDFTCVRNVIEAILCSMKAKTDAYGQAYNITDGEPAVFWDALNYSLLALNLKPCTRRVPKNIALFAAGLVEFKAQLLKQKKEPALTKYGIGILAQNFTLDISKAQTLLNYRPVMTTYEGINEYIEWHKTKK
jgi:nucleoside-diphosphate-sugar epimerase